MGAGYAFGTMYNIEPERRRRIIFQIGLAMTIAFFVLRLTNLYGNPPAGLNGVSPGDFHIQSTVEKTVILFLDVEKYPPSLQFLLMTLGPSLMALAWLEKKNGAKLSGLWSPLLVFGRVPMFYYILHIALIHTMAYVVALLFHQPATWLLHGGFFGGLPENYGHNLAFIYLMWATAVFILYLPCRWFAGVKQRRKDWWLSYI
jgi:uncharacterized membrane protein